MIFEINLNYILLSIIGFVSQFMNFVEDDSAKFSKVEQILEVLVFIEVGDDRPLGKDDRTVTLEVKDIFIT